MKPICLIVLFIVYRTFAFGQKPLLDYSTCVNWPVIIAQKISNDGKYVLYTISAGKGGDSLAIRSTDNAFRKIVSGVSDGSFTEDSRSVIFIKPGDSLCIVELATKHEIIIPSCLSFKVPEDGSGQWVAYQLTDKSLVLYDLFSGCQSIYAHVGDYLFSMSGKTLLLKDTVDTSDGKKNTIKWINLPDKRALGIWQGTDASNFVFDRSESELAFISAGINREKPEDVIWYFRLGMDSAHMSVSRENPGFESDFLIKRDPLRFSSDGEMLFFDLGKKKQVIKPDSDAVSIDIWNYKDEFIQSEQLDDLKMDDNRSFSAVVDLMDNRVRKLEEENDRLQGYKELNEGGNSDYFLTVTRVNLSEGYPLRKERPDIVLINTRDGSRRCIVKQLLNAEPNFSSGGKYVIWYDLEKRAYFTYTIQTGIIRNITRQIPTAVYDELWDKAAAPIPYGEVAWLCNDEAILIYDRYDIWEVDPEGIKQPINITNGYGRKNKVMLRYVYTSGGSFRTESALNKDASLLLCGLNEVNKNNGFFRKTLSIPGDPRELITSANVYYFSADLSFVEFPKQLMKAKRSDTYLIKRMSATEYPNLQITKDFKQFTAVSEYCPQKAYNWLTAELVRWNTTDGHLADGILYKPENFDSHKKYPIIFYFYERLSDGVYKFIKPEPSIGPMDIPWFVSQGYLVFCPDIHYTVGEPGESAYKYVISAAKRLNLEPWVDSKKMGIQGHSFGGYEVNYLVTRTNLFAAASSAEGLTDWVSEGGSLLFNTRDLHEILERGQPRIGTTLWGKPETYIKNSPIFGVNKVTTPLLIMQNKADVVVPWLQGVEFFTALRRLGKRVWMLQYDTGMHILMDEKSQLDYSSRLAQFFDHFLKDAPAPRWMTVGVPARLKGIDRGF